jgi:hypothetical protein
MQNLKFLKIYISHFRISLNYFSQNKRTNGDDESNCLSNFNKDKKKMKTLALMLNMMENQTKKTRI